MTHFDDFPWVKERSECSLTTVFEMLRQQVAQDVKVRQGPSAISGQPNSGLSHGFSITETSESFTVSLDANTLHERVSFVRRAHNIQIINTNGGLILEATPNLNAEGKCVVKVRDQEYPLWYFRKMALEHLVSWDFLNLKAPIRGRRWCLHQLSR